MNGFFGMDITMDIAWILQPGIRTNAKFSSGDVWHSDQIILSSWIRLG